MAKLIPYGICNFKKLILENYYYVDKTHYIEKLERLQTPIFLRPRRFGKSLFTETLRWYYDLKAADRFEEIFGNLYVGKNPTPHRNSYYFLSLDFSGMSTYSEEEPDFVRKQFNSKIMTRLEGFLNYYKEELALDEAFITKFRENYIDIAHTALETVVELVDRANGRVYLAIDEYDSFTNAMAVNYIHAPEEQNEYLNITRKGGFFRSFFEAIKDSTRTALDRVYITGILPITISDMNSGFNIARWITHEEEFSEMLGITDSELDILLAEIYRDYPSITMPVEKVKKSLKEYYNGYRFTEEGELVYNPMMTLYYLDSITRKNRPPTIMADQNIKVQYNQMSYIFGKNRSSRDEVLEEISEKKALRFSVQPGRMFDLNDYKSGSYINECLYYLGLLTYSERPYTFVVPNLVTYEMILTYFERIKKFEIEKSSFEIHVIDYLESGNLETFIQAFFEEIIRKFPGDFFKDVNESFYRGLLFHSLSVVMPRHMYEILPEYNLTNGTVDLMVRSLNHHLVAVPLAELIEIKRVPKSATDAELSAQFEKAKEQALKYKTGEFKEFRTSAICFRGNRDYLMEQV